MKNTINNTQPTNEAVKASVANASFAHVDLWSIHNMLRSRVSRRYF